MRWITRGIGSLVGALFLLIGAVAAISDAMPWSLEGAMLAGLVVATVLGGLIAWWREGIGETVLVIGAMALGTFAYVTARFNKVWAMLFTGGPFLASGILFLASWWRSTRTRISPNST